jgi:WD40 repeat protein
MDTVSMELFYSVLASSGLLVLVVLMNDHVDVVVEERPPHATMQVASLRPASHVAGLPTVVPPPSPLIAWGAISLPIAGVDGGGGAAPEMVLLGGGGTEPIPYPKIFTGDSTARVVLERLLHSSVLHPSPAFPPGAVSAMTREDARSLADASAPSVLLATFLNSHKGLSCVAIAGDATQVAAGFADRLVRVWRLDQGGDEGPIELGGHAQPIFALSWSPEQRFLLSAGGDGGIRLWDVKGRGRCITVYRAHAAPVWDVSFSPAGHYFLSASADQTARLWATDHCQPLRLFVGHHSDVTAVAWHPNCAYAFTGSCDKTARMWDVQSGKCQRVFAGHFGTVSALAVCPSGRYLATGSEDAAVRIWDVQSGAVVALLEGHDGPVHSVEYRCVPAICRT